MSTIRLVNSIHVSSGSYSDSGVDSCCYIPGSSGYLSAYFGVDMNVAVAVTDDSMLYVSINGGSVGHTGNELTKATPPWVVWWGCSHSSFTIEKVSQLPEGGWELGNMTVDPDPGSACNANYNFASASPSVNVGDDASKLTGTWHRFCSVDELETDHKTWFNFYVAFPVANTLSEVNFDPMTSAKITVTGSWVPQIFEYYPWGRLISNEWWSHNRNGGSLTRYNSGWQDVKNVQGNAGDSKGFRYDGSQWNVSPKTGREE